MTILMYHRVAEDGPPGLARWRVTPGAFAEQMAHLARQKYRTIGLMEWLERARSDDPAALDRRVVLTFDDAYLDFVTAALPVLRKYGFGSTLYVPTGHVGGAADWDRAFGTPAPLMSWEQVAAAADEGVEIGAHTVTHPFLTELGLDQVREEVTQSRKVLEAKLGRVVPTFAYPYGKHSPEIDAIVAEAGFALAVTTDPESVLPLAAGRLEVMGTDTRESFAERLAAAQPRTVL
ncbi:MAG TPA: polysaccharide deacetylase family protein [Bauldia sp.]|nr:polysaccharide deacetylase family protein [Bauldia sp.]